MERNIAASLLCLVTVVFVGCGSGPRLVPVTGTVKMDGKPLADAAVQFMFTDYPRPANGRTDTEGKFALSYHNRAGAPIGKCIVMIRKQGSSQQTEAGRTELVPSKYNSTSQLRFEITKKGPNDFNFDLNSDPNSGGTQTEQPAPDTSEEPSDDEADENLEQTRPRENVPAAEGEEDEDRDGS